MPPSLSQKPHALESSVSPLSSSASSAQSTVYPLGATIRFTKLWTRLVQSIRATRFFFRSLLFCSIHSARSRRRAQSSSAAFRILTGFLWCLRCNAYIRVPREFRGPPYVVRGTSTWGVPKLLLVPQTYFVSRPLRIRGADGLLSSRSSPSSPRIHPLTRVCRESAPFQRKLCKPNRCAQGVRPSTAQN